MTVYTKETKHVLLSSMVLILDSRLTSGRAEMVGYGIFGALSWERAALRHVILNCGTEELLHKSLFHNSSLKARRKSGLKNVYSNGLTIQVK